MQQGGFDYFSLPYNFDAIDYFKRYVEVEKAGSRRWRECPVFVRMLSPDLLRIAKQFKIVHLVQCEFQNQRVTNMLLFTGGFNMLPGPDMLCYSTAEVTTNEFFEKRKCHYHILPARIFPVVGHPQCLGLGRCDNHLSRGGKFSGRLWTGL